MEIYETEEMPIGKMMKFIKWFDREIGTDYDANYNYPREGVGYILCLELTPEEVEQCRKKETELENEDG